MRSERTTVHAGRAWLVLTLGIAMAMPAIPSRSEEATKMPFYADKMNLLMYQDAEGEHPVVSVADWARRREHTMANMQLVMGVLPGAERRVPLEAQVLEEERLERVTRQKITYGSEGDHRVPAYLVIPNDLKGRAPAMLCLHGSSGPRGRTAGLGADYPRYTLELAERGYVTIAPDYPLFGDNQVDLEGLGYVSATMKGIWDHLRAVDVLQSLPEVDGERIGCIGVSLGGHNSLFVAAFDPRLKAVACSAGFDSFADYMGGDLAGWCQRSYMPRLATAYGQDPARVPFDFPEVLGALAPRPLFIHAPVGDTNFGIESVRRCLQAARQVYRLFGAEQRLVAIHPPGEHGFPLEAREESYRFLDEVLRTGGESPATR
jgi:dienelactone hydrolase